MERNKWEDEFKEKLNQREVTPTPHAWDRLDALLNEAESKKAVPIQEKGVRKLTWLYIAAGIAAFVLIATVFFKQGNDEQHNEIVNDELHRQPVEETTPKVELTNGQNIKSKTQVAEQSVPSQETVQQTPVRSNQRPISQPTIQNQVQVAQQDFDQPTNENRVEQPDQKIANQINDNGQQVASADTKMQTPKKVKVDPHALLSQVDGELDLTFREKTIKTINRKYQNVKVALANRNNQDPSAQRELGK